jgi:hypothetical protein
MPVYATVCDDLTGFTENNNDNGDVVIVSNECELGNGVTTWGDAAAYADTALTATTGEWCTFQFKTTDQDSESAGCQLRLQGDGSHYYLAYNNQYSMFEAHHHASDHEAIDNGSFNTYDPPNHPCDDEAGDTCDWSDGNYGFENDDDYFGAYLVGEGTGTIMRWYWFGTDAPSDDPADWSSDLACECSAAEIAAVTFVENDDAGKCGFESTNAHGGTEPRIDNFRCGEDPSP